METANKYQERVYKYSESCFFRKTKETFGGLSNMASGYPLIINKIPILSSEALYQACRFPHMPSLQEKILREKSPMTAKMVCKPYRSLSRPDWDYVRTDIMLWCIKIKLAQNFIKFGNLLETTFNKPIVEESTKDAFWGAIKDKKDDSILKGVNALGRLLMKVREDYHFDKFDMLLVESLKIPNFLLYNSQINLVDERVKFIEILQEKWKLSTQSEYSYILYKATNEDVTVVAEPVHELIKTTKKKRQKKSLTKFNSAKVILKMSSNKTRFLMTTLSDDWLKNQIVLLFDKNPLTAKEILNKLDMNWNANALNKFLKSTNIFEVKKEHNVNKYYLKSDNNRPILLF